MFFNIISSSDVRPGDHLYRYRWFGIQEGIAVRYPKLLPIFVVTSYKNTLRLITLNEFKGRSSLRRVPYKQENNYINKTKFSYSRPPEEIVQNAFLLLDWIKTSPDRVRTLFANDLSQFARRCCTTVHEQWRNLFHSTQDQTSSNRHFEPEQVSRKANAFNAALMCGMPFRQASQIGTEDFWDDKEDQNCSVQIRKNSEVQFLSFPKNTSIEMVTFSPKRVERSSDNELLLLQFDAT